MPSRRAVEVAGEQHQSQADTASSILDVAERLVQVRGYNGFSYADVASELEITKASLHYHFAGKAELGRALIERYSERFSAALDAIDEREKTSTAKLDAYVRIYASVLSQGRMCLCGMLAADYELLDDPMQRAVVDFFDANEAWLVHVLNDGESAGELSLHAPAKEVAHAIVGGLEGAMLIARPYGDAERFNASAARLLSALVRPAGK